MAAVSLTPPELEDFLVACIQARKPVLVTGAPGIGKTDIITAAAIRASAHLILSYPSVSDPTDVKGFPWIVNGSALFIPFGEFARVLNATEPTVWFWDDFGQATPAVQAAYMHWLLSREVNGHRLPDCVTIVCATNRRGDRANVAGMIEPAKSRYITIVELVADVASWVPWALDHNQRHEVIAYLRFHTDAFSNFVPSADLTNSPSPRTWSHVSDLLNMDLSPRVQSATICGAVGEGAGVAFNAFLRMYRELPAIDTILLSPDTALIPDGASALYAVCGALASKANPQTFQAIVTYATRLAESQRGEFGVLIVRDSVRRNPDIQHTAAFARMASGELGKLYTGTN